MRASTRCLAQGEGAGKGDVLRPGAFEGEKSHDARFAELNYGACCQVPVPPAALARLDTLYPDEFACTCEAIRICPSRCFTARVSVT